ncbi:hypothetical protein ACQKWADRAFT_308006 [Trichoderma austrokoningii]
MHASADKFTGSCTEDQYIVLSDMPEGVRLRASEKLDQRSDEEISSWLQKRHAVTSEKNVWTFWNKGWGAMRPWAQRNVINWVRKLGPEWTVHVLDAVPESETHVKHFVESSFFPEAFNKEIMDGLFVGPHQGDLVRLPLLWKYGGAWMDVGTLLFRHLDDIWWNCIIDPASPCELGGFAVEFRDKYYTMLNGFLVCQSGNPFIKRWHDIYLSLWGPNTTSATGFHKHPLLAHIKAIETPSNWVIEDPEMIIAVDVMLDYLAHFLCLERLRGLRDPNDGFDGAEYFKYFTTKIFLAPAMQELFALQPLTQWSGIEQNNLLMTRLDGPKDETWKKAHAYVRDAFANQSAIKVSRGPKNPKLVCLAELWDREEFKDADHEEETFASYLRRGSIHYDQTRDLVPMVLERNEKTLELGLLEPLKDPMQ